MKLPILGMCFIVNPHKIEVNSGLNLPITKEKKWACSYEGLHVLQNSKTLVKLDTTLKKFLKGNYLCF